MKLDPYQNKERYLNWRKLVSNGIPEMSKENSDLTLRYLDDMERGLNVSAESVKGARSYTRLNNLREKMGMFCRRFKEIYGIDFIVNVNEEQLLAFFADMRNGNLTTKRGVQYKSVETYAKGFKAFWHWWQKVNKKQGKEILDITVDLDTSQEKPEWVYLNEDQVKKIANYSKLNYKTLILFLFDTGIRAPTELMNVKVSDLYCDGKELNIREEISKTFGRRVKLMICQDVLKEYINMNNLKQDDYLFPIQPQTVNKYLQRTSKRLFGEEKTEAGSKYSQLTMYDFRHISCCYWLPRYKSESALKYRFGWKKSDKIHYYSELLGMRDTISEEDLLMDVTKTEIEKRLIQSENEKEILKDRLSAVEEMMQQLLESSNGVVKVKLN